MTFNIRYGHSYNMEIYSRQHESCTDSTLTSIANNYIHFDPKTYHLYYCRNFYRRRWISVNFGGMGRQTFLPEDICM